jgi:excisionase family DNA binding protein
MTKIPTPTKSEVIPIKVKGVPQFLSIKEFVDVTKVSRQTISRKLKLGEIPYSKIGSRILIPVSFLEDLEKNAWASFERCRG